MAKYVIYGPAYVRGIHLGRSASRSNPIEIELPNDVPPSHSWDPLDEAALRAIDRLIEDRMKQAGKGETDTKKLAGIKAELEAKYKKEKVKPPEVKPQVREIGTNAEIAAAKGANVVGRMSDKSPV